MGRESRGITLIALIIMIIVLLILAGVTITTLTGDNGLFGKTTESRFKSEIKQYEEELRLKIGEEEIDNLGNRTNTINVFKKFPSTGEENENFESEMKANIPSFDNSKYGNKLEIRDDELIYTDEENEQERKWFGEVNLSLAKYFITVNYMDKQGNKLTEPETISTTTGIYEIEPKVIEGYEAERPMYAGKTKQDIQLTITYLQESGDLEYIGLDENGNETNEESKIVAYTVSGIGNFTGEDLVIPTKYNNKPVVQIKTNAFYGNRTIKSLVIPKTIKKVDSTAFYYCYELKSISLDAENTGDQVFEACWEIENLYIGKNVKKIGYRMFWRGSSNLKSLTIATEQADINTYNLECQGLQEIKLNSNNSKYKVVEGVLYSKDGKKIYMYPQSKEGKFIIPNTVEEIGAYAFYGNNTLKEIIIPNTVKNLKDEAFYSCSNLEYATIDADNVSTYSFEICPKLKKVELGKNVKKIFYRAFSRSTNIEEFNYLGTVQQWNTITKEEGWNKDASITKIICSDGEVDV